MAKKQWNEMTTKEKRNGIIGLVVVAVVIFVIIAVTLGNNKSATNNTAATNTPIAQSQPSSTGVSQTTAKPANPVPTRQVTGTVVTLGTGTFIGGKDVASGLYDVTTTNGQSGNFYVSGTDSYNEILGVSDGQGVPKIRVQISDGDSIQISGLSQVIFTPVTAPFVTAHTLTNLYAGTFTVGQDIGAGRYIATTTAGSSGNFYVSGTDSYNEILGVRDRQGVPSVTVTLTDGDTIALSSLSQVTFTPSN